MGDSLPLTLTLPELKYPIGSEPKEKKVSINQHSTSMYISIVESILTADEIERVRGFLEPVMRLSGRSEMKLSGKTVYEGPRGEYEWDLLKGRTHKLSDVLNQLKKTRVDASDERVCLAMLLLVESILLPKNNKGTFPLEYVNKAKDMMYPWGRDAYLVLLEDTSKFELQGYPLVFHLWILESIPLLRDKFSNWAPTVDVPGPIYLCEKYTELENPSLERVLQIEAHKKTSFYKDDVSMEDEHSDELESVKDISKKGYKFKADDWKNRYVDTLDTLDALIHMTIHMTENVETSQAFASIEDDLENTKLNKIIELMMENAKSMKDRMSLLEAENMDLRARVSELEGNQNVAPHTQTPVFPTNVTQQNEEPRVQTHFDVGANVEIASKDEEIYVKWYPGIVLKTNIRNGVGMLKVEYSTRFRDKEKKTKKLQESVSIHSIRPQPPPGDTKGFELMDKVEAYHNDGWCSGEVHIILSNDIYSVRFNSSTEFIKFNLSNQRIPKEWVDGVWKMEKEIEVQQTQSVKPRQDDHAKKGKPVVGMKRKATAHPGKPVVGMKRKATAQPYRPLYINGNKIEKYFFEYLDNAENNLKEKHVDAAFAMLNQKRIEQSSWFSEQGWLSRNEYETEISQI
uniref:Agenet domain-containing protein n=1 Tax=Brassica oleracea var. oleracea TaxID=109376 RepID=A0A0D3E6D5_BRAOL